MFQEGYFDEVVEQKTHIKHEVLQLRKAFMDLEYSENEEPSQEYQLLTGKLQKRLEELRELRLLGGEFLVEVRGKGRRVMEISKEGKILFCNISTSESPSVPSDMSNYLHFRIGLAHKSESSDKPVFVMRYAQSEQFIENIKSIRTIQPEISALQAVAGTLPINSSSSFNREEEPPNRELVIEWKNTSKKTYLKCCEWEELEELLGCFLKRFNKSKLGHVKKLRQIWDHASTPFDSNNEEHEAMLLKLWNTVFPGRPLSDRISSDWSSLGFQGKDPATDFRATGILGLHALLYISGRFQEEVRAILTEGREYPFAVACINIVHSLITDFLHLNNEMMKHALASSGWNSELLTFFSYACDEEAFEKVFCNFFFLLDSYFVYFNAGYMQFPHVMSKCKAEFREMLARRPMSTTELSSWVNTQVLMMRTQARPPPTETGQSTFHAPGSHDLIPDPTAGFGLSEQSQTTTTQTTTAQEK